MIKANAHPASFESLDIRLVQRQAGADAVEQHATRTPARARSASASQNSVCNLAGVKQERLEVDCFRAAPLTASSMTGKIIFPLCRSSILFPVIASGSAKAWAEGKNSGSSTVNLRGQDNTRPCRGG